MIKLKKLLGESYDPTKADFLNAAVKKPSIVGATKGEKHNAGWRFEFRNTKDAEKAKDKMIAKGTNINSITFGNKDGQEYIEVHWR